MEDEYWDIWGNRHIAEPEVQRSILQSMGFEPASLQGLNAAIQRRHDLDWAPLAPPTLVLPLSGGVVPINVPDGTPAEQLHARFEWEGGATAESNLHLDAATAAEATSVNGHRVVRRVLPLPASARLGYHRLILTAGSMRADVRLILCPDRAYQPDFLRRGKRVGIAVSVYGLKSGRNWGCGDFTDLRAFCDWAAENTGVSFIALNPLHSIPNRQPFNTSPYLPNCSFYRNPLYLDVAAIPEVREATGATSLMESREVRTEIETFGRRRTLSTREYTPSSCGC